jgi:hypothetical protein
MSKIELCVPDSAETYFLVNMIFKLISSIFAFVC